MKKWTPGSGYILIVLILSALLLFACTKKDLEPIRLGVVLPLSGDFEIYGSMGLKGIRLAVDEINNQGGVLDGRKLELIIEDNKTDPAEGIRLMRKMIQKDDVIAVFGPVSSAARNAMTEVAHSLKTPLLYGIDYEGGMYDRYLFCYSPIPDHYIKPVIPYLMENDGRNVYIFGYDYVWPHKMTEAIRKEVTANNGKVVGVEFTPFGVKDFSPVLERINNSGADVLILIQPGPDGFNFIHQFSDAGMKKKIRLVAIAADETYLKAVAPEDMEGIYTALQFIASADLPQTQIFVKKHREKFGMESIVTYSTDAHYNLVRLFARAINKVGSPDKEKIIDAMENITFETASGQVTMREDHHVNLNMFLAEFTHGELNVLHKFGLIVPDDQRSGVVR